MINSLLKMNKKGQAALEFLMTYGWAILVVLIVIGALAFFLSSNDPTDLIPEGCNNFVNAGVVCTDYQVKANSSASSAQFVLEARARDIEISDFTVTLQGNSDNLCGENMTGVSPNADGNFSNDGANGINLTTGNYTLLNGNSATIVCLGANATAFGSDGETINLDLSLTWKELNDEFDKTSSSSAVATITDE